MVHVGERVSSDLVRLLLTVPRVRSDVLEDGRRAEVRRLDERATRGRGRRRAIGQARCTARVTGRAGLRLATKATNRERVGALERVRQGTTVLVLGVCDWSFVVLRGRREGRRFAFSPTRGVNLSVQKKEERVLLQHVFSNVLYEKLSEALRRSKNETLT